MNMKTESIRIIISFAICAIFLSQTAFAAGISDTEFYKSHPQIQADLEKYWQTFLIAKTPDMNPGKLMAAQIRLGEIEEGLEQRGFTEESFEQLRTQAQEVYVKMLQKTEDHFSQETFTYLVDQLLKLKPETTEHFKATINTYIDENPSRKSDYDILMNAHNTQVNFVEPDARFAFFKITMSYFLISEAQNYAGTAKKFNAELNSFSGKALADFLILSDKKRSDLVLYKSKTIEPVVNVFAASGMPDLSESAKELIDHYKESASSFKTKSFFKNLSTALKGPNFHMISLFAPIITAGVASFMVYTTVSTGGWEAMRGQPLLWTAVIYGMAVHFFKKDVIGKGFGEELKTYRDMNITTRRSKERQLQIIKQLEKTCEGKFK